MTKDDNKEQTLLEQKNYGKTEAIPILKTIKTLIEQLDQIFEGGMLSMSQIVESITGKRFNEISNRTFARTASQFMRIAPMLYQIDGETVHGEYPKYGRRLQFTLGGCCVDKKSMDK